MTSGGETQTGQSNTLAPLYRPPNPCESWQLGAVARRANVERSGNPYTYPGKRWEWEAGWDYEDREIASGR
jgi:hypothetical protein